MARHSSEIPVDLGGQDRLRDRGQPITVDDRRPIEPDTDVVEPDPGSEPTCGG